MARSDWDIHGIIVYMDDSSNIMDIYEYAERKSKYIPIDYIAGLLTLSDQRFVDMLNEPADSKKHLITSNEEYFRRGNEFSKYQVFEYDSDITVELADFEYWLDDNYELLKENRATPQDTPSQDWLAMQEKVAALEAALADSRAENDKLRAENEELKNAPLQGGEAPRLRTMWRYVLELEEQGKPDDVIREALHGDGFSYTTADALLYDGTGKDSEAVKKWGQRKSKKGDI